MSERVTVGLLQLEWRRTTSLMIRTAAWPHDPQQPGREGRFWEEVAMMHRSFVIALLAIISVLVPSKPAVAQTATGPPCAAHREVLAFLQQVVGERLIGSGL